MADKKLDILINIVKKLAGLDDTKKGIIGIGKESEKAGKKGDKSWKKLEKRLKSINKGLKTGITTTVKWGKQLATSATAAAAGLGALAVNAAKFNIQIARAQTMAKNMGFWKMRQQALDLSNAVGVASSEISNGLYQALSGGVPEENVFSFVETAAKVAVADCSDVATAVDGLTTVLNAFNVDSSEADKVADAMFKTVANGKTTFADLAQNLSTATSVANGLGVSYNEILAAAATLTKGGASTAEAMTGIKQAMLGLNRELGDGWAKTYTLQEALEKVARESGYSSTAITKAFGQEGVTGVLGLVGDNAKRAKADLEDMADAVGTVNEAHAKVDIHRTWDKAWTAVQNLVQQVGNVINETIKPDVEAITERINSWTSDTSIWDSLKEKLGEVRELVIGLWEAVESGQGQKVFEAVADLLMGYIHRGGEMAGEALKKLSPEIGELIGKAALSVIKASEEDKAAAADAAKAAEAEIGRPAKRRSAGGVYGFLGGTEVDPNDSEYMQSFRKHRYAGLMDVDVQGLTAAQLQIEESLKKLVDISKSNTEQVAQETDVQREFHQRQNESTAEFIARVRAATESAEEANTRLADAVSETESSFEVVVEDVEAGTERVVTSMEEFREAYRSIPEETAQAADTMNEAVDKAKTDLTSAADTVTQAADDATSKIGEGLKKNGEAVAKLADTTTSGLEKTNSLLSGTLSGIVSTLSAINQQLSSVQSQVSSQAIETDIVKRQLASMQ